MSQGGNEEVNIHETRSNVKKKDDTPIRSSGRSNSNKTRS